MTKKTVKCYTVGDLLDALTGIANDPALRGVLDSAISEESGTYVFDGFDVIERTLTDGSTVLDFELIQSE